MSIETTPAAGVDGSIDQIANRIEDVLTDDMIDEDQRPIEPTGQKEEVEAQRETEELQDDTDEETVQLEAEQLADLLGLDPDNLIVDDEGKVSLRTKVNGEESAATLQDVLKGYQLEKHVQQKSQMLAEQTRQFGEMQQQAQQAITANLNQAAAIVQQAEQQLMADLNSVDWNTLRQQYPEEWSAKQLEFQQRGAQIEQLKQQAVATANYQQEQLNEQANYQRQQMLAQESQLLRAKIPEWRDDNVFKKEMGEIKQFLLDRGYPEEIVRAVSHHQFIADAREFMQFVKAKGKNTAPEKKVAKVQKPKARVSKGRIKAAQTRKNREAIRRGDSNALVSEIEKLL